MLKIKPTQNTSRNLRWINLEDFPTHYQRTSGAPSSPVVINTLKVLTDTIIGALRMIGVDIVSVTAPPEGYVILGYDNSYGMLAKDSEGTLFKVLLQ